MTASRRASLTALACSAALVAGAISGCSSSGAGGGTKLTKAEFITKMDARCAQTLARIKTIAQPTGLTDYAAILNFDAVAETEQPAFQADATVLVDESPDKVALHKNWIDLDKADFAALKPILVRLDAAARAENQSALAAAAQAASSAPDHSTAETAYLKSYGLTDCATLANYGNS